MSKFTEGPWQVIDTDKQVYKEIRDKQYGTLIAKVLKRGTEEDIYNAPLIAAAPDMYAVLKEISGLLPRLWGDYVRNGYLGLEIPEETIEILQGVLAKAEGREESE